MKGAQLYVALENDEMPEDFIIRVCPVCEEENCTVECRFCGVDIIEEEERIRGGELCELQDTFVRGSRVA